MAVLFGLVLTVTGLLGVVVNWAESTIFAMTIWGALAEKYVDPATYCCHLLYCVRQGLAPCRVQEAPLAH